MKIQITIKDPDGISESVDEAVRKSVEALDLDEDEESAVFDRRREKTWEKLEKFIRYQEYICVEIDTEAGTAIVLPARS